MWRKINVLFIGLLVSVLVYGANDEQEIQYLIDFVAESGVTFIRNGTEHSAPEAADHLQMKYSRASRYARTAEGFIDNLASKSSITRRPYQVVLADGTVLNASDWLYGALHDYRALNQAAAQSSSAVSP
ncbi:DUF5329 domain-containing protein [Gilvimarinus chinensis]|uniref:DUF5329 family protein n=1 Tax=Gilvimarinus chinensis TaxID=396005 RepID=UPI000360C2E9|nr:DUF5329 domain-containing protein [Gilvimarinus chinensis]